MKCVLKSILLFLLLSTSFANSGNMEDIVKIKDLSYTVRFYYDKSKEVEEEVLFVEQIVKNIGKKNLVFSFYDSEIYVSDIEPMKQLLVIKDQVMHGWDGVPSPPTPVPEDVIRLAPGEKFKSLSWFWANGIFPYPSKRKGKEVLIYQIGDKTKIKVRLCVTLISSTNVLGKYLKSNEQLLEGTLCSKQTKFRYKLLSEEDVIYIPNR